MSESSNRKSKAADDQSDPQPGDVAEPTPVDQTASVLAKAAEATKDVAQRAADAVAGQYDRASRGTRDAYRSAVTAGAYWEEGLERYVRRNPITSLLATAGVSLLIGFALGRQTAEPPARRPWWRSYVSHRLQCPNNRTPLPS